MLRSNRDDVCSLYKVWWPVCAVSEIWGSMLLPMLAWLKLVEMPKGGRPRPSISYQEITDQEIFWRSQVWLQNISWSSPQKYLLVSHHRTDTGDTCRRTPLLGRAGLDAPSAGTATSVTPVFFCLIMRGHSLLCLTMQTPSPPI